MALMEAQSGIQPPARQPAHEGHPASPDLFWNGHANQFV